MLALMNDLWSDDKGFLVSAELALILTIGVIAVVVGIHAVAGSVNHELNDVAGAIGALDQSYRYDGFVSPGHSYVGGSGYHDAADDCDCSEIVPSRSGVKSGGSGTESRGVPQGSRFTPTPAPPRSVQPGSQPGSPHVIPAPVVPDYPPPANVKPSYSTPAVPSTPGYSQPPQTTTCCPPPVTPVPNTPAVIVPWPEFYESPAVVYPAPVYSAPVYSAPTCSPALIDPCLFNCCQ